MQWKVLCLVLVSSFVWISVSACGSPGKPANGIIKHFLREESFEKGGSVEYECSDEYQMFPSFGRRRTCNSGSWSGQVPVCARKYEITSRMSVCLVSRTPKCDDIPYCLAVDNKQESWKKIILDKQYHISVVTTSLYGSECDKAFYLNISVSNNSTTRYFDGKGIWSINPGGPCHYECQMEDESSPLADTINIAVSNLPAEQVIKFCNIGFLGNELSDCGHPDSPLYSAVTYSNDSRTAFFECESGYRAVGNNLISRCTDDLRWTKLDVKCIEFEELPPVGPQTGDTDLQLSFILVVIPLGLLLCTLSTILGNMLYRRWQKGREQQDLIEELQRMEENRRVALNPDVPLDEQSHLLSYNQRWEFPKERLKLGNCLGEGAFGTVVKAEAIGIIAGESSTTVAVKIVKYQGNKEHLKALLTELKILAYVGHHINIVNLLGAVTKNLIKGELMVITEYCEFGNLRNFLLCQRDRFINQIDPETGDLTTHIGAAPTPSEDDDETDYQLPTSRDESKNFLQGKFRSSLQACRQKMPLIPPVSTRDLISYAFQCARGMEFLSSKKLVHRDLAARNVLLAENKVAKICDFGLSRKTYQEYAYVRKGKGPLPIKWMAIESICDGVFTQKSDVWSFGVLLWEIFTLGADPYPGVECDEEFYDRLKGGYRMKKPDLAPNALHKIMQQTWQGDPKDRPTFTEIAEMLGNMLEQSVRSYYLDLNVRHSQFNETMAQDMQVESRMICDSIVIGEDVASEMRESDVKADLLVCVDVNGDVEEQFSTDFASLDDSQSASPGSCENY